jgi:hypothetical protein
MRNVISSRQTELALSTGQLFTTDEALKIGLIDEVATDKADAIARAEKFLLRMSKISSKCNSAMLYKVWGFYGSDYEGCRLLGYENPVRTSQETCYVSATESSRLCYERFGGFMAVTMKDVIFWDIKTRFVLHRRHITFPLQSPAN